MELVQILGLRITQLLEDRNMTQYGLFACSGVPCPTISVICAYKVKDVKLSTVLNICRGLNVRLTDFFNTEMFEFENISDNAV